MRRSLWLVAVLAALSLVAAACGSNNNKKSSSTATTTGAPIACDPGTISGAGSTFVQNIAQQWIKDFQAKCSGATVTYQGVGSGAGIQQFTAGTIDFGGTDVPMSPTEEQSAVAKSGQVATIPWSGGGIAVEYNLSGVSAAVKQTAGAVGYAEVSFAKGSQLGIASIKNASGAFVQPDSKNVTAALAEAQIPPDLKIKPNYKATGADAYPIATPTFALA